MGQSDCNGQWSHWWLVDSCLLSTSSLPPSISLNHPTPPSLCLPQNSYSLHYRLDISFSIISWKSSAIPPTPIPITFCWEGQKEAKPSLCRPGLPYPAPAPDTGPTILILATGKLDPKKKNLEKTNHLCWQISIFLVSGLCPGKQ